MPHGAAVCLQCGFDTRKGKRLAIAQGVIQEESAKPARQGKCPRCGYSLKGLRAPRCPECGQLIGRETDREKRARESAETVKWAYLKPLIQLAVGLGGVAAYCLSIGEPELMVLHLFSYVIEVPLGTLVFLACCLMWIGFDAPVHLIALRLAAIYALVSLTGVLVAFIPIWIVQRVVIWTVFVGLLSESLDMDLQDAIIVGLLMALLNFILAITVVVWLVSQS